MLQTYPTKSYRLFSGWLLLAAVLAAVFSWRGISVGGIRSGRFLVLLLFLLLDLLYLMIYLNQKVYWAGAVTYEEAKAAGPAARKRYALFHLLIFSAAALLQLAYCFSTLSFMSNGVVQDSIVSGTVFCAAAAAAGKIRCEKKH